MGKQGIQPALRMLGRRVKMLTGKMDIMADRDTNGLMPANMVKNQNQIFVNRTMTTLKNILDFGPGFYKLYGVLGHPLSPTVETSWVSILDVTQTDDKRLHYELTDTYTGKRWFREVLPGSADDGMGGWAAIHGEVVLWQGSSKLDSAVKLLKSVKSTNGGQLYDQVKVQYRTDLYNYGWGYSHPNNPNEIRINTENIGDSDESLTTNLFEGLLIISDDTAVMTLNRQVVYGANSTSSPVSASQGEAGINVTQIVGVI
ncbi:hypothetical protein [Lactiplantibacillus mudanjiangensis]|uniref:Uncharacterized protein n=1 Tax=Lactiplantibacillus mudanjiangensis TaxID=1296538 RepID=A0A660DWX8_9LACO|nr:hypothetical protein [Lactiplantibacillus mudanjiangensis]VDG26337.1 protein of unknown function [Lactobacillus sakei] [Lactiplantibacillus mudanjiangensis]VDG27861.1 protein of unknown function [Lactobacillus sakei] [Lactiplantibacillus mudanjiangensis]